MNACPKGKFPYRPPTPRGRGKSRVNFRALDITEGDTPALGRGGDEAHDALDPELVIAEYAETVLHEDPNDPYCIESEYEDEEYEENEEYEEEEEEFEEEEEEYAYYEEYEEEEGEEEKDLEI